MYLSNLLNFEEEKNNTKITSLNTTKELNNMRWLNGLFPGLLHNMLFLFFVMNN